MFSSKWRYWSGIFNKYGIQNCDMAGLDRFLCTASGVARILKQGALEDSHGHKAPEKFWREATPTNYDVLFDVLTS